MRRLDAQPIHFVVIAGGLLDRPVLGLLIASGNERPRRAASVRYPARSPCAEKPFGSRPAAAHRRLTIKLIDCGVRARSSTAPHRSIARNIGPFEMSTRSCHSFSAVTGGPTRSTALSSSATIVLVRPSRMASQARAVGFGSAGSRGTGGSSCNCSRRRDLAAPPAPGGKGDHQDREVVWVDEPISNARREQPIEDVAGHGAPALSAARTARSAHGAPQRRRAIAAWARRTCALLRARVFCSLEMYLNQLHKQSVLNIIGFRKRNMGTASRHSNRSAEGCAVAPADLPDGFVEALHAE